MDKIKIVLCGCGVRGANLLTTLTVSPDYAIVAVCDPYKDKADNVSAMMKEKYGVNVEVFTDHIEMFEKVKPDAAIVATSWEEHVKVAIDALERRIAVALEVGTAYCEEECLKLIEVYKRTGTPCMFMENCCFGKDELLATSLARNGVFGDISIIGASKVV